MSKKYNNYKNNNNNVLNINIEELKGKKITLNNDSSKYLVLYPGDINFVAQVEDLLLFAQTQFEKLQEEDIEEVSDENLDIFRERLNKIKDILNAVKEKFNLAFNDSNAYDRIFGNVADIELIILVITKVYEFSMSYRETEDSTIDSYTAKYKK